MRTYVQKQSERDQPNGYPGLDDGGRIAAHQIPAASGVSQLWVWDAAHSIYVPSSTVRMFFGPVDPTTVPGQEMNEFDSWTPSGLPS